MIELLSHGNKHAFKLNVSIRIIKQQQQINIHNYTEIHTHVSVIFFISILKILIRQTTPHHTTQSITQLWRQLFCQIPTNH